MIGVKSRGIQPVTHLVCELILWLCGLSLAIVWIIFTIPYSGDPTFKDFVIKWTDLFCFWSAVVLVMAYVFLACSSPFPLCLLEA